MEDFWEMGFEEAAPYALRIDNIVNRAGAALYTEIPLEMQSALASIRMMWDDVQQGLAVDDADRVFDLKRIFHLLLIGFEGGFCMGWYLHKTLSGAGGENLSNLMDAAGERELISGNRMPGVKHEYDYDFISVYGGRPDLHGYLTVVAHLGVRRRDPSDIQTRLITVGGTGFVFGYIARHATAQAVTTPSHTRLP